MAQVIRRVREQEEPGQHSFRPASRDGVCGHKFQAADCCVIPSGDLRAACKTPFALPLCRTHPSPRARTSLVLVEAPAARCARWGALLTLPPPLPPPLLTCCCPPPPLQMARALGKALRETGQALDRLGRTLQGNFAFREERECAAGQRPAGAWRRHSAGQWGVVAELAANHIAAAWPPACPPQ